MARRPINVNKQSEILRLKGLGMSERSIARSLKCSRKTVKKYYYTPIVPSATHHDPTIWYNSVDWDEIHLEHREKGVGLNIIWEEQKGNNFLQVNYPAFWKQYTKRYPDNFATMVRQFDPGDRLEIDYCDGIAILDPSTGEVRKTHLFVGVLCYSRYTFAEFSYTQSSKDFLNSHVRMFNYFGGVPRILSPDNLKSAVTKAHPYDPEINPAYSKLAEHYNLVVEPARVKRPKDKAIVERTIQIFQRWFFMKVRRMTFTSLVELNKLLQEYLKIFNSKIHRTLKTSRQQMFDEEKKHLQAITDGDYIVQTHKRCTLHSDCHIEFEYNYYSAPWKLRGEQLDVWVTEKQIKIYSGGNCVAIHARKESRGKYSTDKTHYPPNHQAYLEITPYYLRESASAIGPNTLKLIELLMPKDRPLRYLRKAQGIVALKKKFTREELEYGCDKALLFGKYFVRFIEQTITAKRDLKIADEQITRTASTHLRGDGLLQ